MDKSKKILATISVLIIFILIITNSILFKLYIESEREKVYCDSFMNIITEERHNILTRNETLLTIKEFIIEECEGSGVFYRENASWTEEMLVCMMYECTPEGYCKSNVKEFLIN